MLFWTINSIWQMQKKKNSGASEVRRRKTFSSHTLTTILFDQNVKYKHVIHFITTWGRK